MALDGQMLAEDYVLQEFRPGDHLTVGPFQLTTRSLSHFVPNVGVRLTAGDVAIAYTGDGGADAQVVGLAAGARLLLAEATFADHVPEQSHGRLASARQAGKHAAAAQVEQLVLTHLLPDTEPDAAVDAARRPFDRTISVAVPGLTIDLP